MKSPFSHKGLLSMPSKEIACLLLFAISSLFALTPLAAQEQASGYGFNYFERQWITDNSFGAGYSFYAGVWPIMEQYPGSRNFQLGLPSTWLAPLRDGTEPTNFYNTIEGGLGWWGDTRFATETPKFIMGGVAFDFNQWANGVGAGSTAIRPDGHRDWNDPEGKYGVAQLSPNLLWPPDGLNMEQGANGDFLGYGYHPLPLTDVMEETNGEDFTTGNQCWTLFLNSTNFKGPATFFIPTFWTETILNDPSLEGFSLDSRPSDKNLAFAIEYAESPALIGADDDGNSYARILPLVFPKTSSNTSEVIREIKVYSKDAKWNAVEAWFNGGQVPPTAFQSAGAEDIVFAVNSGVDGNIAGSNGSPVDAMINFDLFAEKISTASNRVAGFEWDTSVVEETASNFILPEFYQLNQNNLWDPVAQSAVPSSTGLLTNEPTITPRSDEIPYLTPIEPDCHLQDPQSAWNSPGPSAGPFTVKLGDDSKLTYYWYRFIDQPSIINANLSATMRQNLQDRVEMIHTHWSYTDEYLDDPTEGTLVGLDAGLIVSPPAGMEIGYVPIVTRQEKDTTSTSSTSIASKSSMTVFPNPTRDLIQISAADQPIVSVQIYTVQGQLRESKAGLFEHQLSLKLDTYQQGIYMLQVTDQQGNITNHRIIKN
ncbi:MAG: T9SS type A sorting domain-containing protein [Saprospiraceae bacterium]